MALSWLAILALADPRVARSFAGWSRRSLTGLKTTADSSEVGTDELSRLLPSLKDALLTEKILPDESTSSAESSEESKTEPTKVTTDSILEKTTQEIVDPSQQGCSSLPQIPPNRLPNPQHHPLPHPCHLSNTYPKCIQHYHHPVHHQIQAVTHKPTNFLKYKLVPLQFVPLTLVHKHFSHSGQTIPDHDLENIAYKLSNLIHSPSGKSRVCQPETIFSKLRLCDNPN